VADIVIINPRFDISFWGLEHCMPLFGKRANLPVACLALLAALVREHHDVTLIDENVIALSIFQTDAPDSLFTSVL
jgi:hypothetical protein